MLLGLVILSVMLSTGFGAAALSPSAVVQILMARWSGAVTDPALTAIVWELRLPRALLAVVVGAGLAVAGTGIQTLVRNPLADPYLLGVSSGASVGAVAVLTSGAFSLAGLWALSAGALVGALLAAVTVFGVTIAQGGLTPLRLVLTGTVLGSAFSATASFLIFRSGDPRAAESVLFWLLGSLAGAQWQGLALPALTVLTSGLLLGLGSSWLDALAAGPATAHALGVAVAPVRYTLFGLLSVLVGVLVAAAGSVGFVGLVLPHAARLLVGARHRRVVPVAAASGALFLLWVDVFARVAARPVEIPLSVVTGIIGAPAFLLLLGRRRYRFSEVG